MIVENVFNMMFDALSVLLGLLPDIQWDVQGSFFTAFYDVLSVACYFLPMATVSAIISLIVSINLFKILVSLLKTIMQLIPFV